jgi:transposase
LQDLNLGWEIDMTTISILGIDIAKNTFLLHGADHTGKGVMRKRLARRELAAYVANFPPCMVVMESCGEANYWALVFQRSGHTVKLISPQFVKPFVMTNKNDANDAQAIVQRRQTDSAGNQ